MKRGKENLDTTVLSKEEREFLDSLYLDYSRLVYSYARNYFPDQSTLEDIVQLTFLKMITYLPKLITLDRNVLPAYIVTMVKSVSIDYIRKAKIDKSVLFSELFDGFEDYLPDEFNLEEIIIDSISSMKLGAIINRLPERDQFVLSLKYLLSYTDQEIADLIKVRKATVRTILLRARNKAIRLYLSECHE